MEEHKPCVFVASGEIEAQQVQAFLDASGIPSVFSGESLRKTHGLTLDGLGMVNIFVSEADGARARELLASAEAGTFRIDELPQRAED
jgi:Putative prokaryotic signal transducing protein